MATPPRIFENGFFYHVYNRGNRKQPIFLQKRDYERFLEKVEKYKEKYGISILAYCLMPNHFHFLVQQVYEDTISKFFSDLCNSQSKYFNVKYQTVGTLFQGRFKAKKVDKDEYLIHLSRYIHLNPVEFLPVNQRNSLDKLIEYKWSSLSYYLSDFKSLIVDSQTVLEYFSKENPVNDYKEFLVSQLPGRVDPFIDHLVFEDG